MGEYIYVPWIPYYSIGNHNLRPKQDRDRYDAFMKAYHDAHAHCPKCGSNDYCTTLVGYIVNWEHPETYRDGNRCECTSCGWVGITHDMV